MKRVLTLFLAVVFAIGICFSAPVVFEASAEYDETSGFYYSLNDDGKSYSVTAYGGEGMVNVVIPSEYKGLPVTTIESWAFHSDSIKTVTIPSSIKIIEDTAFQGCSSLSSIVIPDSVESVGESAFKNCSALSKITIGKNINWIGANAFYGSAYYLNSSNWQNGALYIGNYLIVVNEEAPEEFTVKTGTICIADEAFSNVYNSVSTVNLPASVKVVADSFVFSRVSKITVDSANPYHSSVDGVLFNKDKSELICFPNEKDVSSYAIPSTVRVIARYSFANAQNLLSVNIPSSVKEIGFGAFAYAQITSVALPDSVEIIENSAFDSCYDLMTITIGKNVKQIGNRAFEDCGYYSKESNWEAGVLYIGDYLILADSELSGDYTVKAGTKLISNFAFYDCFSLTGVIIPEGVKYIGECAFAYCEGLVTVKLPEEMEEMADYAFYDCNVLKTLTMPTKLNLLGYAAFSGSYELQSVVLPTNLKVIPDFAFEDSGLTAIVIPASVEEIGVGAFTGTDLVNVTINSGLKKIGEQAFMYCFNLKTVKYNGLKVDWNKIQIDEGNDYLLRATLTTDDKVLTLSTPVVTIANCDKGIEISWNIVQNAEYYIVYRRTYNPNTKKYSGWTAFDGKYYDTSIYVDTGVKLGQIYSYTVRAVNGNVKSDYKATNNLTYNVTPTVKVALAAKGIKVSWSTVANATGYTVYSSTYNTKTKKWSGWTNRGTTKANATSWVDKKVKSGTKYRYTVKAMNDKVGSTYNKDGAATLYLAQPTVKIANASTGVKVSWNKVTGATGYTVYRSEYKNGAWTKWASRGTAKANKTSWTDTKVASGVQYKYTVRAINGKVASTYVASNTLLYLAQPKTTVKAVSNGINVSWTQSTGATGYTVYRSEYNAKTKKWSSWKNMGTAKSNKKSWTDKSAKKGVTYRYTVKAVNGKVASTYKASGNVKR